MKHVDEFITAVRTEMQPEGRANPTASTLEQLKQYIPACVTFADIAEAWGLLTSPPSFHTGTEDDRIIARRKTCSDLYQIAQPFLPTSEYAANASLTKGILTWQAWEQAFTQLAAQDNDPRHNAMAETFARERKKLETRISV